MDLLKLINTVGGILGIVGVVTAAVFISLNQRKNAEKAADDSTMITYKSNAEALNELLDTRDKEIIELKASHLTNLDRIKLAESKADILEKQVTQAPSINKLILQMAKQHKEIMTGMSTVMTGLSTMTNELGNIAKSMKGADSANAKSSRT